MSVGLNGILLYFIYCFLFYIILNIRQVIIVQQLGVMQKQTAELVSKWEGNADCRWNVVVHNCSIVITTYSPFPWLAILCILMGGSRSRSLYQNLSHCIPIGFMSVTILYMKLSHKINELMDISLIGLLKIIMAHVTLLVTEWFQLQIL